MVLIVLAIVVAGAGVFYAQTEMQQRGPLEKGKIVTIKRGMGSGAIARMLEKEGVISNAGIFMAATYVLRSSNGSLKAGEYQIPASSSMAEVLGILQAGKSLAYKVTIPEGWTTQNALARIAANKVLKGNITVKPGEGTLLPDTYVFQRGTTRDGLIARMQAAQKKLLDKLWSKRQKNLPIKTRAEAITLASIVERETGIGAERPKVAAVFVNRLKKKMRLQSDPTIIYGIVGGKGKMDRPLSKKDIAKKTRYNTYQIDGLPPTPIANPGREAIAAVLNPDNIDALYFVADGSGGHAFAKTLKGHENNVSNWRKIEHDRRKAAAAKTAASKSDKKATPAKKLLPATKQSAPVKHPAKPDLAKTPTGKSIPLPPVKPAQN
ncbi:MAG TPA: endolytic transglycosylase MltG [Rhizobiales bacterium]|nr:endolytic transglycosylase MltG [Hyphomicrobiales bacterium]